MTTKPKEVEIPTIQKGKKTKVYKERPKGKNVTGDMNRPKLKGTRKRRFKTEKALALKSSGLSYDKVGLLLGVSGAAVAKRIRDLLPSEQDSKLIKLFNDLEKDIIAGKRMVLLEKITPELMDYMLREKPQSARS